MTTNQAVEFGLITLGPILLIVGIFFALAITVSQYHHLLGKAIAWPLSVLVGLVWAAHLGGVYLPDWEGWSLVWFMGYGVFFSWMLVGLFSHQNITYHYGPITKRFIGWLGGKIKSRTSGKAPNGKAYRARAPQSRDGDAS